MNALFTKAVRRELEPVWAADTRRKLLALGLWPTNLSCLERKTPGFSPGM